MRLIEFFFLKITNLTKNFLFIIHQSGYFVDSPEVLMVYNKNEIHIMKRSYIFCVLHTKANKKVLVNKCKMNLKLAELKISYIFFQDSFSVIHYGIITSW